MNPVSFADVVSPDLFKVQHAVVGEGTELAYVHEGSGGVPLLMLHGWPSTKRIYYRNIATLAARGFEVVVPDASGWGDSPARATGWADQVMAGRDYLDLMHSLGHERFVLAAFDQGSVIGLDLVSRYPERVLRQVLWSALVPFLPDAYAAAGIDGDMLAEVIAESDHAIEHADHADRLLAELATPEARKNYVKGFYQGRVWKAGGVVRGLASPGAFDDQAADFHSEPFGDGRAFRDSLRWYETLLHPDRCAEPPILTKAVSTETMFMVGVDDFTMSPNTCRRAAVAYENIVGPFLVKDSGHFLPWEQPRLFNDAVTSFCRDLLDKQT